LISDLIPELISGLISVLFSAAGGEEWFPKRPLSAIINMLGFSTESIVNLWEQMFSFYPQEELHDVQF